MKYEKQPLSMEKQADLLLARGLEPEVAHHFFNRIVHVFSSPAALRQRSTCSIGYASGKESA